MFNSTKYEVKKFREISKEFNKKSNLNNQFPILSSSIAGIERQEDYFNKQVANENNEGYKIVPRGSFTYRSMSDTGIFKFNIQDIVEFGLVSPAYPVFEIINANPKYIYYLLNNSKDFLSKLNKTKQGGTRFALNYEKLSTIEINLHSLKEQQKIGSFLSAIDKMISLQSTKIYNKEILKKHFLNYFFLNLESFKNCEFREATFNDLGELYSGYGFPEIHQRMDTTEIPFFKVSDFSNLENSRVMLKSNNYIDKETAEKLRIKISKDKGIVFAKLGAAILLNRKRILNKGSIVDNNLGYLIPSTRLNFEYVYQFVLSLDLSQFIQATSVPSLSYSGLKSYSLKIHDTLNQEKIGLFLGLIDKLIILEKRKETKLKDIKAFYLKEIFNN